MPNNDQHDQLIDCALAYVTMRASDYTHIDRKIDDRDGFDPPSPIGSHTPDATVEFFQNSVTVKKAIIEADTVVKQEHTADQLRTFTRYVDGRQGRWLFVAVPSGMACDMKKLLWKIVGTNREIQEVPVHLSPHCALMLLVPEGAPLGPPGYGSAFH